MKKKINQDAEIENLKKQLQVAKKGLKEVVSTNKQRGYTYQDSELSNIAGATLDEISKISKSLCRPRQ